MAKISVFNETLSILLDNNIPGITNNVEAAREGLRVLAENPSIDALFVNSEHYKRKLAIDENCAQVLAEIINTSRFKTITFRNVSICDEAMSHIDNALIKNTTATDIHESQCSFSRMPFWNKISAQNAKIKDATSAIDKYELLRDAYKDRRLDIPQDVQVALDNKAFLKEIERCPRSNLSALLQRAPSYLEKQIETDPKVQRYHATRLFDGKGSCTVNLINTAVYQEIKRLRQQGKEHFLWRSYNCENKATRIEAALTAYCLDSNLRTATNLKNVIQEGRITGSSDQVTGWVNITNHIKNSLDPYQQEEIDSWKRYIGKMKYT